ncbi:MAG TPA: O-antigen ligase family protein, partial [Pseudomonadales bacterium]
GVAALSFLASAVTGIDAPFLIYPNHFALLLILPICVLANEVFQSSGKFRVLCLIGLCLLIAALALTKSRGVYVAFAVAVGVGAAIGLYRSVRKGDAFAFLWKASALAFLVLVLFGLVEYTLVDRHEQSLMHTLQTLLHPDEGSFGGRLRRWQNALPLILAHPVFGGGFGSWHAAFDAYRHAVVADSAGDASALNTYLLLAAETGLIGLALFVGFCAVILLRPVRQTLEIPIRVAFLVWLVALTFHSVSDFLIVLTGFAFVAGMALWRSPNESEQSRAVPRSHLVALLLAMFAVFAAHGRHTLGSFETTFANDLLGGTGSPNRLVWRLLAPMSPVIDHPTSKPAFMSKTNEIEDALDWTRPAPADPRLYIARIFAARHNHPEAERWFRLALDREPTSRAALLGICRTQFERKQASMARQSCAAVLSRNPTDPEALQLLASIETTEDQYGQAFEHLSVARKALWNRLDVNDFGTWTLDTASRYYGAYRRISDLRQHLVSRVSPVTLNVSDDIDQTPLLHSVVAPWGCKLYFSANINARYHVWVADACNPATPLALRTNDSLTPYQLQATPEGLYFISDRRGDARYQLYFMAHDSTAVVGVPLPPGILTQYKANRRSNDVAAVVLDGQLYKLVIGSRHNGFREVYATEAKIEGLDWHPKTQEVAFIEGERALKRWNAARAVPETLVGAGEYSLATPSYSPTGSQLAVSQRSGQNQSKILACALDETSECRVAFASDVSLALGPVWPNESEIVFRETANDEYLLRRLSLPDNRVTPIGIAQGVVYPMVFDPMTDSLWFCAATQTQPIHIASIRNGSDEAVTRVRLDWIEPAEVLPAVRSYLEAASVYTIMPPTGNNDEAIVWLHGGGGSFSPRWNSIAQELANGGYRFVALNYSTPWSLDGDRNEDWSTEAGEVEALVQQLRARGIKRVHLAGVSTGTKVLQQVLRRDVSRIDSAIELSPVHNTAWDKPHSLPPMLIVTGANDPLLGLEERKRQVEAQRTHGSSIDLLVLPNEGHEFRGREATRASTSAMLAFLNTQRETGRP